MIEHEQKKLVNYLVYALPPEAFRNSIKKKLDLAQYKSKKSNVIDFVEWMADLLRSFVLWESALANAAKGPPGGGRENGKDKGKDAEAPPPPPADGSDNAGETTTIAPRDAQPNGRSGWSCLKCESKEHRVKDCPQIQPGEDKQLIAA